MVAFVHVADIFARAQATMETFAAELGEKFKVKSMMEKFGVEREKETPVFSGLPTLFSKWMSRKLRRRMKIC